MLVKTNPTFRLHGLGMNWFTSSITEESKPWAGFMICWTHLSARAFLMYMEALGYSTLKSAIRSSLTAAKPEGRAVVLVERAVRQCDRYANSLEDKLLDEYAPEAREQLTPFVDECRQWLAHLRGLVPHTDRKARRPPKAKKTQWLAWWLGPVPLWPLSVARRWSVGGLVAACWLGWPLAFGQRRGSLGCLLRLFPAIEHAFELTVFVSRGS